MRKQGLFTLTFILMLPFTAFANDSAGLAPPDVTMQTASGVPAGAVMAFNLGSCPNGWIASNGANGTVDLRGEFIRGWDAGRGIDAGRTRNSLQDHAMQRMTGTVSFYRGVPTAANGVFRQSGSGAQTFSGPGPNASASRGLTFDNSWGANTANETRPRNRAMLYCQKE